MVEIRQNEANKGIQPQGIVGGMEQGADSEQGRGTAYQEGGRTRLLITVLLCYDMERTKRK